MTQDAATIERLKAQLLPIRFLLTDVDGVLTDGLLYFDHEGNESKVFHVLDGAAFAYWHRAGFKSGFVSGRDCPPVMHRARRLKIDEIHLGHLDKLPVVEAMASGVPVITSNTSALEEIANGYAELVNPLDVEKMAQSIVRCLRDREYREDLAQRGRARSEEFVWRHAAEQTLAIYRRVLEGGIPTARSAKSRKNDTDRKTGTDRTTDTDRKTLA